MRPWSVCYLLLLAAFDGIQSFLFSAVQCNRLYMDCADRYNMCAVFFVKVLQIGQMLEVVGVNLAALYNVVRLYIIGKFLYL